MRIGIDIKAFKNGTTGIARYLKSIMDCLQEVDQGNDYVLFECSRSNYKLVNPRWQTTLFAWKLTGFLWQQVILPIQVRKHEIDVLWAPEQTCPIFLTKRVGLVTTIHDLVVVHFPHTSQLTTRIVYSIISPFMLRRSDALVTVSEYVKNDVLNTFRGLTLERKLFAIPNGRPDWQLPATYSPGNRKDFLFFAGAISPRKNLGNLIKALIILKERGLKIKLHLAGPQGWKNREIHEIMNKPEIKQQISYLGYLSEEELKSEYLTCKALVYPSIYEGFGLPVLEALCLDCLVLTSRKTVMEEIAKNSAIYFDPNDPGDIAAAIEKVYQPGFEREAYLALARKEIRRAFSWHDTARELLAVLTETAVRNCGEQ